MSRTTEPTTVAQGEQIEWTRCFEDHPADEWTLKYRFRGPGTGVNIDSVADGEDFVTTMTAVQSAALVKGKWKWQAWATNIADTDIVQMIDSGVTEVLQGFPDATTTIDLRSPAKIALDAIDAALAGAATSDQLEYEITTPAGSRRVKRMSRSELIELRKHFAMIVSHENDAERVRTGGKFAKPIKVTMRSQ